MRKAIRDWTAALCLAIIAAFVFRSWFFAPFNVQTESMAKTIQKGDHLFISKHAYGFDIPFLDKALNQRKVERGDIIVFPFPLDPDQNHIKRVIGVSGDTIKIIGETVFINGIEEETDYLYFDPALLTLPEHIEVTVPDGKLWVMGDNRRNSKDSRFWGFVDEATVIGKAEIIFWSHNPNKSLLEGYDFDRIGIILDKG